jgi:hypothetical protein
VSEKRGNQLHPPKRFNPSMQALSLGVQQKFMVVDTNENVISDGEKA